MANPHSPVRFHYASLQAGRAVAAIGVLLFHVWLMARDHLNWDFLGNVISHGARGVDFFFVLSGFIFYVCQRPVHTGTGHHVTGGAGPAARRIHELEQLHP